MADILNSILWTITSPFQNIKIPQLFPNNNPAPQPRQIQNQQVIVTQNADAKAQLRAIDPQTYNEKWLSGMSENEARGRLQQHYAAQQKQSQYLQGAQQVDIYHQQNVNMANQLQSQNMRVDSQRYEWEQRQKKLLSEPMPGFYVKFG